MSSDHDRGQAERIARHASREHDPAERGRAFGHARRDQIHGALAVYRRMFAEDRGLAPADVSAYGAAVRAAVESYRPALRAELDGIAAAAGVPREELFAVNARTELLSGGTVCGAIGAECSTVALLAPDRSRAVLAQTWDFHPALRPTRVVWTCVRADGSWHATLTEAGLLAKFGVNSHGVALAMNFMATDRDGAADGVPVHVLIRAVLEEARTVQDARRLIEQAPATSSSCLTVAGPDEAGGVSAESLERWPGGVGVARPAHGGSFAHTNHFLTSLAAADLIAGGPGGVSTRARLEQLRTALAAAGGQPADVATAQRLLSIEGEDPPAAIFRRPDERVPWLELNGTLATLAFEVPAARMWLRAAGDPAAPLDPEPSPVRDG